MRRVMSPVLGMVNPVFTAAAGYDGGATKLKIAGATSEGNALWLRGVHRFGTSGSVITFRGYLAAYMVEQRAIEKTEGPAAWVCGRGATENIYSAFRSQDSCA